MDYREVKSKKELIKDTAARLFRKKGFSATSMRDIASEVGMEAASLYNHIRSKQEILQELLMFLAEKFTFAIDDIDKAQIAPEKKIEKLVELHVRLTVEHTDPIALITSEWVHLKTPQLDDFIRLRNDYEQKFLRIIEECIDAGVFHPVNPEIALFSILSTLRWLYAWYSKNDQYSQVELEQQMIHCLVHGLKKS